jgi:predicted aspartyl protease
VRITRFDPRRDLIIVDARVGGPLEPRGRPLRLALDTGAAETIIVPDVLDELGYNPRQGEAITVMRSAVGHEQGYLIGIERFDSLGYRSRNFRVHAQDLPEGWGHRRSDRAQLPPAVQLRGLFRGRSDPCRARELVAPPCSPQQTVAGSNPPKGADLVTGHRLGRFCQHLHYPL